MDFDQYAGSYDELLRKQHAFFSRDRSYFHRRKVEELRRVAPAQVRRVLDYGCGTGGAIPEICAAFPRAEVVGYDPSAESLAEARRLCPNTRFMAGDALCDERFDLVYMSCVMHHVPPERWTEVLREVAGLLSSGGVLSVFEHNPLNPITRKLVRDCPFDADAVLLSMTQLRALFRESGLSPDHSGYFLFVPERLGGLRRAEQLVSWLPLGGQYFVAGTGLRTAV